MDSLLLQAIRSNKTLNYFNFKPFGKQYLLTNDTGAFLFLTPGEFHDFLSGQFEQDPDLKQRLSDRFFIQKGHRESFVARVSPIVRQSKSYLMESTQLHIFILTSECNYRCVYCQASAHPNRQVMSKEVACKAVDLAFQSPSKHLNFEFQGGEPLLNFETLRFIVEYTEQKNKHGQKDITFNVVSNLSCLSEEFLRFLVNHHVHISTSLDGPDFLQNKNRPSYGNYDYESLLSNIERINREYGELGLSERVQAIQTTTRYSLLHAEDIVNTYVNLGFRQILLRPVVPFGFAKANWSEIGFVAEEYLAFYRKSLDQIVEWNRKGVRIREGYASLLLNKILGDKSVNYMELRSPCGGTIGQLAYHHDGSVYSCDEGRMLGEAGDASFKVGTVNDYYPSLLEHAVTKTLCVSSCLESIPGCSDCVYQPYCGTCPIYNYSSQGNVLPNMNANFKCQIHKGMLDFLFDKIHNGDEFINKLFIDWAREF